MSCGPFTSVAALRAQVEGVAAQSPNAIRTISDQIKAAIRGEVDPYVLTGVLIEGIAMTILAGIPAEKQTIVSADVICLLYARLDSLDMVKRPEPEG